MLDSVNNKESLNNSCFSYSSDSDEEQRNKNHKKCGGNELVG